MRVTQPATSTTSYRVTRSSIHSTTDRAPAYLRIVDQLVSNRQNDPGIEKLTPREREILALIAEGRSNSSIAELMGVTKRAVERHINGIFATLDLPADGDVNRRVKATLLYLLGEGR